MKKVLLIAVVLWAAPLCATADELGSVKARPDAWSADHPIAIGTRASGWFGDYFAPGLGGHIKIRPWSWLGVELFSDNFARPQDGVWRHDHVIGFSAYLPAILAGDDWFIGPSLGACVDFRFAHPEGETPSTSDILFGVHGGLMAELFLANGFSMQMNATVYAYIGHETEFERWSAQISNELQVAPQGLVTAGLNYYF